jgi:hypothetical protein
MLTGSMAQEGCDTTFFLPQEAQLSLLSPIDLWHVFTGAFKIVHIPRKTRVGTCH